MSVKYSFIVPVYNVEDYVEECLQSILKQRYKDFEIIIVDDGGTDKSYDKCANVAQTDARIKIIRQQNKGLGEARNTGIRGARGEYLIFVDSDDFWLGDNCLNEIDAALVDSKCNVLCFRAKTFDNQTKKFAAWINKYPKNINSLDFDKRIKKVLKRDLFLFSAWSKVVSKDLLIDNNIFFNKGLSEDMDWDARLLIHTNKFFFLGKEIYAYRKNRNGSITNEMRRNYLRGWCEILDRANDYYVKSNCENGNVCRFLSNIYRVVLINYIKANDKDEYVRKQLLNYKYLIKYFSGKMCILKLANLFSLNLFLRFLRK